MAKEDYVTFLDSEGNEISNDPRWHAERVLREAGVEAPASAADTQAEIDSKDAEIAALRAQLEAQNLEDDENASGGYSEVKGQDLVKLAKERGIDLTVDGKKLTAPQVREALVAQDASK